MKHESIRPYAGHPLVGNWCIVSHETIFEDGERLRILGDRPNGRLILTACGFMTGFVVASDRKAGHDDSACAALHRSMIAYSGPYRIESDRFVVSVDIAWNHAWEDSSMQRTFRIEGNTLHIESARGPNPWRPGRMSHSHLQWTREAAQLV